VVVVREPYDRLIEATRLPRVKLQVLPLRDTTTPVTPTNLTLIEFAGESDPDVYVELLIGGIFVEGPEVRRYSVTSNNLRAAALGMAESIKLIEEVAAGRV